MIQANELRIGNWVSFKGLWNGRVGRVSSAVILIEGNGGVFDLESFEPIELTHDVLLKAGFVHGFVNKNWETYTLNGIEFSKMKDGYSWDRVKVIHLHQLQNLYYSLVGQELTLSL